MLHLDSPELSRIRSLDPVRVTDVNSSSIAGAIYEGLLGYAPDAVGRIVPALARSWEISADNTVWTFRVREGVRFHDDPCFAGGRGRLMTAGDVHYSLLRTLDTGGRTSPLPLCELLVGADEYVRGVAPEVSGVRVLNGNTLRITLRHPSNAFPHALASAAGWVVPREAVERYGAGFGRHPVGTGPFRLAAWDTVRLVLVRNLHYWKEDDHGVTLPYLDGIVMIRSTLTGPGRQVLSDLLDGREVGDVLVVDRERTGALRRSSEAADRGVVGIVSGEPGVLMGSGLSRIAAADPALAAALDEARRRGDRDEEARLWSELERRFAETRAPVALSGTVPCKVDAGYGAIRVGDLLTTSPTPGHAMRAEEPRPGTILGKALEPLDAGRGLIRVLVVLR